MALESSKDERGRTLITRPDGHPEPAGSNIPALQSTLWATGGLRLRLIGPDGQGTIAIINRPFALIGRASTADIPVLSRDASLRHVYLHRNAHGVFAVDLVSRTGTRFDDAAPGSRASWLRPGSGLELAGHRVELLEPGSARNRHPLVLPEIDPLAAGNSFAPLVLRPEDDPDQAASMLSELSFLGRSRACALRVEGEMVARVHAVLVRSASGSFLVNLAGSGLTINGEPSPLVVAMRDGDQLGLGRRRFLVQLPSGPQAGLASPPAPRGLSSPVVSSNRSLASPALSNQPESDDVTRALQAVRDGQDDLIRTNDQFQHALVAAVRQLYQEQNALFEQHLDRLDRLQHEVAELRAELRERLDPSPLLPPAPDRSNVLPPPASAPRDVPRPSLAPGSERATSWLIDRLGELEEQVEQESRSGWRDLLSRLGTPLRARDGL
ncbi:FHA domain-containing protein [Tautonia rosea]|uniref:FHA domain-containing protein n=1 Tax=Tautonia rosea TaxID=2728037 RepID=UPI001475F8DF|nr:FHA domain-containing protein [Tautonia rosea]